MFIHFGCIVIIGVGCVLSKILNVDIGTLLMFFGALSLFAVMVITITLRYINNGEAIAFAMEKETINNNRNACGIENYALKLKIIELNGWLATQKYFRDTIFSVFISPKIETLDYIE